VMAVALQPAPAAAALRAVGDTRPADPPPRAARPHRHLLGPHGHARRRPTVVKYDLPGALIVEADGPVRTVTMNRPEQLNAVSKELHWALANVWRQLAADTDARVVILTGAGRAFSAGGDMEWITTFPEDPAGRNESLREGAQI